MGNTTSNASESENSSMKVTVDGPRPNDSLDVSFQKIGQVKTRRERRKDQKDQAQLEALPTKIGDQERTVEGWTPFTNKGVHKKHDERVIYVSCCVNNNKFLVKRDCPAEEWTGDEVQPSFIDMTAQGISNSTSEWCRPKFERTRTVTLIFCGGILKAVCDCPVNRSYKWCCRHICHLLKRKPQLLDASTRWWNHCTVHFDGPSKEFDAAVQKILSPETNRVFVEREDLREIKWDRNLDYFNRSLGCMKLRGPSFWTSRRMFQDGFRVQPQRQFIDAHGQPLGVRVSQHGETMEFHRSQHLT